MVPETAWICSNAISAASLQFELLEVSRVVSVLQFDFTLCISDSPIDSL